MSEINLSQPTINATPDINGHVSSEDMFVNKTSINKNSLIIILLIFLLSAVSVFAIYLLIQVRALTISSLPSPTPIASASPDDMRDWLVYNNPDFGIKFNYPPELKILGYTDAANKDLLSVGDLITIYKGQGSTNFLTNASSNKNKTESPSELPNIAIGKDSYPITKTIFGEGTPSDEKFPNCFNSYEESSYYFAIPSTNLVIVIRSTNKTKCDDQGKLVSENNFEKNISTVKQILSSFELLNLSSSKLIKNNYSLSEYFFDNRGYPQEIKNLQEKDLVGFTCSPKYTKTDSGTFEYSDKEVISYLAKVSADAMVVCDLEDSRRLIIYDIFGHGGGAGSSSYFGIFDKERTTVAEIPMENSAYFACGKVLAITKSNTIFVECGGGDGGSSSKSLYRVGLYKAFTSDLLLKCSATMESEGSSQKTTCGSTL